MAVCKQAHAGTCKSPGSRSLKKEMTFQFLGWLCSTCLQRMPGKGLELHSVPSGLDLKKVYILQQLKKTGSISCVYLQQPGQ